LGYNFDNQDLSSYKNKLTIQFQRNKAQAAIVSLMKNTNKVILIPLLYKYYLFEYFNDLAIYLCNKGHKVILLSFNQEVLNEMPNHERLVKINANRIIRFLYNRSKYLPIYILMWPIAHLWGRTLKEKHSINYCILPWDNKTIWYVFSTIFPSMTISNTTNWMDLDNTLETETDRSPLRNTSWHKFYSAIDDFLNGKFFYRYKQNIFHYDHTLLWDRLFGKKSKTNFLGFSPVRHITVPGHKIKDTLIELGLEEDKIKVYGNPSYQFVEDLQDSWNEDQKTKFLKENGLPANQDIYTLFLSPSSFSEKMRKEIIDVVKKIHQVNNNSYFVIKFHPKTVKQDPPKFAEDLSHIKDHFQLITDFHGDLFNAKMMLVSKAIVQKQCTLGMLAIRLKTPIISYNLVKTNYEDDMYKIMKASFHCEDISSVEQAVKDLSNPDKREELNNMQDIACYNYSLNANTCKKISDLIYMEA